MTSLLEPLIKLGLYSVLLVLLGTHAARWLLRAATMESSDAHALDRRMTRLAVAAAWTLFVLLFARLAAHSIATFGTGEGLSWDNLVLVGLRSRWGGRWRFQLLGAVATILAVRWARTPTSLLVATAVAIGTAGTFPLTGHAAGDSMRILIDAAHLVAAGLWLGTLAVLVRMRSPLPLFERFSPLAFVAVAIAVTTGLTLAALYLGTLASLWTTTYGRLLLAKLALVAMTAGCGFVNWRSLQRGGAPPLAIVEALLAVGVVAVTAFLTETEHP